jgi:hypothetical protein
VDNFTATSGVIIIKYTTAPTYAPLLGDYFGIYYQSLTVTPASASVQLANSITLGENYAPPETATLEAAKAKFTAARVSDFIIWDVVQPQGRE